MLLGPGTAVDLTKTIAVTGHSPPRDRYYLTDVTLAQARPLLLPLALFEGMRLVPRADVVPAKVSTQRYDRVMRDVMLESQDIAAVVAERAAGYRVATPATSVVVDGFTENAPAQRVLQPGDTLLAVAGAPVHATVAVAKAVSAYRAGTLVPMTIERDGQTQRVRVPTMSTKDGTRFGILVGAKYDRPRLPVSVSYAIGDISGSSGGLMFALDIYRSLKPLPGGEVQKIAGTGTIAYDGTVGPIEGAPQKVIAAKRAGASVFLVPKENANDLRGTTGITVIPVATFDDALHKLARLPSTAAG